MTNLFFLIMVCVVAIMAAENDRSLGLGMPELAMGALAAGTK